MSDQELYRLLLARLEGIERRLTALTEDQLPAMSTELALLKQRQAPWGAGAGMVASAIVGAVVSTVARTFLH